MLCWAANLVEACNKEVRGGSKIARWFYLDRLKGEGWRICTN